MVKIGLDGQVLGLGRMKVDSDSGVAGIVSQDAKEEGEQEEEEGPSQAMGLSSPSPTVCSVCTSVAQDRIDTYHSCQLRSSM